MKKLKKSILFTLLTITMVFTFSITAHAESWPYFNSSKVIKTFPITTRNDTPAFSDSNLRSRIGTIYASDELFVQYIGRNRYGTWYCSLTYPTSRGRKYGCVPLSVITGATSPSEKSTSSAQITSYRQPSTSYKAGAVYRGDTVYKLSTSGNFTQVLYNIGSAGNPSGWRMAWITTSNYNSYVGKSNNPQGWIDHLSSPSAGKLCAGGWTFDRDNLSSQLRVDIYVGGPAGSGAPGYSIWANKSRPDVNRAYPGVGNYHGFEDTISVSLTGVQTVYLYAINVGGGNHTLLGSQSVNIKGSSSGSGIQSPVPAGCKFSYRTNDNGWTGYHDINRNVSTRTPVYAIADGTVTYKQAYRVYSGTKYLTSYGNFIEFKSSSGGYSAKYCHLNQFVGTNQIISSSRTKRIGGSNGTYNLGSRSVRKGEIIGYIGTTGNSSGIHLHFELRRNGTRIDPTYVFAGLV